MGTPDLMFSSLSPSEKNLVQLMQSVRSGRIRQLPIRCGQPVIESPMTIIRVLKLRPEQRMTSLVTINSVDFPLKAEVVELFRQTRAVTEGMIERLEIADGLPIVAEMAEGVMSHPTSILASAR